MKENLSAYVEFDMIQCIKLSMIWEYVSHVNKEEARNYTSANSNMIACSIPLSTLFQNIDKQNKIKILQLHNISCNKTFNMKKLDNLILFHSCSNDCKDFVSLFKTQDFISEIQVQDFMEPLTKNLNESFQDNLNSSSFPPTPKTKTELEYINNNFCEFINPDRFEESGCTVCGQLYPTKKMVDISIMKKNWYFM